MVFFGRSDLLYSTFHQHGSSDGVSVKLLTRGAIGPGFEPRSREYKFREFVSLASKSLYDNLLESSLIQLNN